MKYYPILAICLILAGRSFSQSGLGVYITKGFSKFDFPSFENFINNYNDYYSQSTTQDLIKPFDLNQNLQHWGMGVNFVSKFFYAEIGYGRFRTDYVAEYAAGTQHVDFKSNNFESVIGLGIGFETNSGDFGFIGGGIGLENHKTRIENYFAYPNGTESFGEDRPINGIYRPSGQSVLKGKASIRAIIPIKFFSIIAKIDYQLGNDESDELSKYYDHNKGLSITAHNVMTTLPQDINNIVQGNFTNSPDVFPNYHGWIFQLGVSFFLR